MRASAEHNAISKIVFYACGLHATIRITDCSLLFPFITRRERSIEMCRKKRGFCSSSTRCGRAEQRDSREFSEIFVNRDYELLRAKNSAMKCTLFRSETWLREFSMRISKKFSASICVVECVRRVRGKWCAITRCDYGATRCGRLVHREFLRSFTGVKTCRSTWSLVAQGRHGHARPHT